MLVGLNGQLGSGKDTVYLRAKVLFEDTLIDGFAVERRGFADKLKESVAALFCISVDEVNRMKDGGAYTLHRTWGSDYVSWRTFLQRYGTESHRDIFGDDFWVEQAMKDLDHEGKLVFFTDCRFPNEVAAIKAAGGKIWEVIGPDYTDEPTHSSEQIIARDLIDRILINTKRDDAYRQLDFNILSAISGLQRAEAMNVR